MRVLITGGCGFIGSYVAERFVKEGHSISIIDNLTTGLRENVAVPHQFYQLDAADQQCEYVFQNNRFDIVIYLAANGEVGNEHSSTVKNEADLCGLVNIMGLSQKYGNNKFIFISSTEVYAHQADESITEATELKPRTFSAVNKMIGELYCQNVSDLHEIDVVILRVASVYGPRQSVKAGGVTGRMAAVFEDICNKAAIAFSDRGQVYDFIYVEDVANAIYKAAMSKTDTRVLTISTNTRHDFAAIEECLASEVKIQRITHQEKRLDEMCGLCLDNAKTQEILDWSPRYSFRDGVIKTYHWYQENSGKNRQTLVRGSGAKRFSGYKPYLDNLLLSIVMALFYYGGLYLGMADLRLGVDYNYLYIYII